MSALKHGVDPADALAVMDHPQATRIMSEDPLKVLYLGFGGNAVALEVVAVLNKGRWRLIHAMRLRKTYWPLLLQGAMEYPRWKGKR
ncbi:toxin [Bifidobacterium simiarum]|uniref:Toxin n=2 Tax=Bifidobacterium simiarum TaxID=2045441 RepID=A0A2M9HGL0_9BIFI|nr:toxin [Bifidobacterium simiarum]